MSGLPEDLAEQLVTGPEVVDQHPGRRASRSGQRLEPIRESPFERVVGTGVEEPLPDFWLPLSPHALIFSRNSDYDYDGCEEDGEDEVVVMRVVFVHGACVRDGSWWWHRTGDLLADQGVTSEAPLLPSCGETGEPVGKEGPGLAEDVASVRNVLAASGETVVVAHSYGGIVTAEAATDLDTVRHVLLISSYLPEVGESLSAFGDGEPAPFLDIDPEGGIFTVRPDALAETFLQDCDPEIQQQAIDKTANQSLSVLGQPVQSVAWRHVPSTYLVCTQDRGTPVHLQRLYAERARRVVELESGHHPFLSRPAAVRDLILGL